MQKSKRHQAHEGFGKEGKDRKQIGKALIHVVLLMYRLLQLQLELKANFVLTSRSKVDFSPADEAKVQEFIEDMRQKLQ